MGNGMVIVVSHVKHHDPGKNGGWTIGGYSILILAGVLQGDTLAPYIFIIAIDYVMREALAGREVGFTLRKRKSRRHPEVKITDTDYADDLSLLSDTIEQAYRSS
eukprot:sb/3477948/